MFQQFLYDLDDCMQPVFKAVSRWTEKFHCFLSLVRSFYFHNIEANFHTVCVEERWSFDIELWNFITCIRKSQYWNSSADTRKTHATHWMDVMKEKQKSQWWSITCNEVIMHVMYIICAHFPICWWVVVFTKGSRWNRFKRFVPLIDVKSNKNADKRQTKTCNKKNIRIITSTKYANSFLFGENRAHIENCMAVHIVFITKVFFPVQFTCASFRWRGRIFTVFLNYRPCPVLVEIGVLYSCTHIVERAV